MADKLATDIVRDALALRASHPDAPALEVLDIAMEAWRDSDPVFDRSNEDAQMFDRRGMTFDQIVAANEAENLVSPSGAFGKLLTAAFWRGAVASENWDQDVLLPFAQRYGLWNKRVNLPCALWVMRCVAVMVQGGNSPDTEDDNPGNSDEHFYDGAQSQAEALYLSPMCDGLTPEAAAAGGWSLIAP